LSADHQDADRALECGACGRLVGIDALQAKPGLCPPALRAEAPDPVALAGAATKLRLTGPVTA
jgi:hypothetical protein